MCRNFDKTYWHYYFNIKINFAKFVWPTWPIYYVYYKYFIIKLFMSLREKNSHDNFSELSYFSGVVLYECTRIFAQLPKSLLEFARKLFTPPPLFATAREKSPPGTRKRGKRTRLLVDSRRRETNARG